MRKIILAIAVLLSVSASTAQESIKTNKHTGNPKTTPEQRAQQATDKLDKRVTLSPEQKTEVYNLSLTKAKKMELIHTKYKDQPDQKEAARSEMKTVRKEYKEALKPILTPEQNAKIEAERMEHKEGKGHTKVPKEQRAQKTVDRLDETVSLSPEQKTKTYDLALTKAEKVDAIRLKYKDQPEQKETAKAEIKAAHKEYHDAVKLILTPEQNAKLKAKHKEQGARKPAFKKETEIPAGK